MGNHQSQRQKLTQDRFRLHHPAQLSIIIPTLNEQSSISQAIQSTKVGGSATQPEVIVVDGGSKDRTRTVAASHTGVRVLSVPEGGRGLQLNRDCQLPQGYFEAMKTALNDGASCRQPREWGCFCTIETSMPSMRLVQWGIRMRTWIRGQPYGDQGLFCSSRAFQITNFQRWPFLEDLQWVTDMNKLHGRPAIAEEAIQASPRRWLHYGVFQTTCLNQMLLTGYSLGVPVNTLHWFYNSARSHYTSK